MKYICVRIYGNGNHINCVFPFVMTYRDCLAKCDEFNAQEDIVGNENKWIPFPVFER